MVVNISDELPMIPSMVAAVGVLAFLIYRSVSKDSNTHKVIPGEVGREEDMREA